MMSRSKIVVFNIITYGCHFKRESSVTPGEQADGPYAIIPPSINKGHHQKIISKFSIYLSMNLSARFEIEK